MKYSILGLLSCFFLVIPLGAHAFTIELEDSYQLGEGESQISARENLIQKLTHEASTKAGKYIQSETQLTKSGELVSQIQAVSASMIKVDVLSENLGLINGRIALTIKARLEIDDAELKNRIRLMQEDKTKAEAIRKLQAENEALLAELAALKNKREGASLKEASQLTSREVRIRELLAKNSESVASVFKQGTLFAMAQQDKAKKSTIVEDFSEKYTSYWLNDFAQDLKPEIIEVREDGQVTVAIPLHQGSHRMNELFAPFGVGEVVEEWERLRYKIVSSKLDGREIRNNKAFRDFILASYDFLVNNEVYVTLNLAGEKVKFKYFGISQYSHFHGKIETYFPYNSEKLPNVPSLLSVAKGLTESTPEVLGFIPSGADFTKFPRSKHKVLKDWRTDDKRLYAVFKLSPEQLRSAAEVKVQVSLSSEW